MDARFQAITDDLLRATAASRTTIRLDGPDDFFPVVAESLAPGAASIAGIPVPGLRDAPTMRYLQETLGVLVQDDLLDTETPPPAALVQAYGARAQVLASIVHGGRLAGFVSVHHGPDVRRWTEDDVSLVRAAAARAEALL